MKQSRHKNIQGIWHYEKEDDYYVYARQPGTLFHCSQTMRFRKEEWPDRKGILPPLGLGYYFMSFLLVSILLAVLGVSIASIYGLWLWAQSEPWVVVGIVTFLALTFLLAIALHRWEHGSEKSE